MAQLSIKYLIVYFGLFFEGVLCWFGYFLYQTLQGINVDLNIRNHKTIIFCTLAVFFFRILLMWVDYDKKKIEIEQKKTDLDISKENLREQRLKNDAEEKRQKDKI